MENLLNTELPKRFTDAIGKLYNAFHNNELNAYSCDKCAVWNMCDNDSGWSKKTIPFRETGVFAYDTINGYSIPELAKVEHMFMWGKNNSSHNHIAHLDFNLGLTNDYQKVKESQFKGLCAVVEYLCELDNIPNVMDIQSLFEYENDTPKRQLSEILI